MGVGLGEAIVIGFIVLVVFSAARMGQLGNALGRFVYSFKKAAGGSDLVDATPRRTLQRRDTPTVDALPPRDEPPRR